MRFVRYGGANARSNKHKKEAASEWHVPPARRGVYAFPLAKADHRLIDWKYRHGAEALSREARREKAADRREIEHCGNVWHHLGASAESMGTSGSWALDRVDVYEKKLRRRLAKELRERQSTGVGFSGADLEVFIPGKI